MRVPSNAPHCSWFPLLPLVSPTDASMDDCRQALGDNQSIDLAGLWQECACVRFKIARDRVQPKYVWLVKRGVPCGGRGAVGGACL